MSEPRLISVAVNWNALTRFFPQYLPAWLMSLVFHLSLVLLLALVHVVGTGSWHGNPLALNVDAGGVDGLGDEGAELLAEASALPDALGNAPSEGQTEETPPSGAEQALEASALALADDSLKSLGIDGIALDGHGTGDPKPGGVLGSEGAAGSGDGPTHTDVFGLAAEGTRFVYVFDRSESMNSVLTYTSEGEPVYSITPLEAAKAELLKSLKDLDRRHRFHIVFYNNEPWLFDPGQSPSRMVVASRENKRRASLFVHSVYGHGNTNHIKPLELALRMKPDVIFVLTDGEAKDDPTDYELAKLHKLNDGATRINVVQFCYSLRTRSSLVRLANENGGQHKFINISHLGPGAQVNPALP
jgi:hypothetical protein